MKPTVFFIAGLFMIAIACKNPKPDLSGMNDGADTTKMDTSNNMDDGKVAEVDSATMMKAWENFMTPGDMHKWMAKWDGTWTAEVSTWMGGPEAPPEKSTATVTNKMIMNGLYQTSDYSGTMMGQPFMGHAMFAYDNAKKQFVNTWIDNMGSGVVVMTGSLDTNSNTLSLKGTQTNPVTGKDAMLREEIKYVDDNTQIMTMWGEDHMTEKEQKFMEITMKRKM